MSIPEHAPSAHALFLCIQHAEGRLGGAATPEWSVAAEALAAWIIHFRGVALVIHPVNGDNGAAPIQIHVYKNRDTTSGRRGTIIFTPEFHRCGPRCTDPELIRAADTAVEFLLARPPSPWGSDDPRRR